MVAALLAGAAAHGAPTAEAQALQLSDSTPIHLDARCGSDFDYKSNVIVFRCVRISQGALAIEADGATATGLDFKGSTWVFKGKVHVTLPDGALDSDEARIAFADNLIATAEISGSPAVFEQKRDKTVVRGRALRIEYVPAAGRVRLLQDAWLSNGANEMSAQTIVYSLRDQRVLANPDEQAGRPVSIIITPQKTDTKPPKTEPKADPKAEPKADSRPEPKPNP